jgi:hypothetical protein
MHLQHLFDTVSTPLKPSFLPEESDYASVLANSDGEYLIFIASPGVIGALALHTGAPYVSFDVIGGLTPVFATEPTEAAFVAACGSPAGRSPLGTTCTKMETCDK